jgi:hypothetical protein
MATDHNQLREPSSESLEAGYETSTVSVKALAWFVVGLIATAAVIHVAVWLLYREYVKIDERSDKPFSALTDPRTIDQYNQQHGTHLSAASVQQPPPPQIQPTPPYHNLPSDDLREMHRAEDELFRQMGWTVEAQDHTGLHIPPQVIAAVIRHESERRQKEKK